MPDNISSSPPSSSSCPSPNMSLYHEAASVLDADLSAGGNLRSRVFSRKDLKSSPNQVYALALETCKWSAILSEIIDQSQLLHVEKKVSTPDPILFQNVHETNFYRAAYTTPVPVTGS